MQTGKCNKQLKQSMSVDFNKDCVCVCSRWIRVEAELFKNLKIQQYVHTRVYEKEKKRVFTCVYSYTRNRNQFYFYLCSQNVTVDFKLCKADTNFVYQFRR